MIEFAIVILVHRNRADSNQGPFFTNQVNAFNFENDQEETELKYQKSLEMSATVQKRVSYTEKIDIFSFLGFMISYIIFNSIYFACYI